MFGNSWKYSVHQYPSLDINSGCSIHALSWMLILCSVCWVVCWLLKLLVWSILFRYFYIKRHLKLPFILRVWMCCLHVCVWTICVPGAWKGLKVLEPLELEFQEGVSCHVVGWSQTQVLWKSNVCSWVPLLIVFLSNTMFTFYCAEILLTVFHRQDWLRKTKIPLLCKDDHIVLNYDQAWDDQ